MTNLSREICAALTALLRSRTEWDEAPCLYNMYLEDGAVDFRPIIPEGEWPSGPPAVTLLTMADAFSNLNAGAVAHLLPPGFIGMAFRVETWGAQAPVGRASELLSGPRPSQRSDRVEQRCAYAVTRDGRHYVALLSRGEKNVLACKAEEHSGRIPTALERAMHALTAAAN